MLAVSRKDWIRDIHLGGGGGVVGGGGGGGGGGSRVLRNFFSTLFIMNSLYSND